MNIFVGNLAFTTTEQDLRQLFEPYGAVDTIRIMTDRETGRSRGFGFVEMPDSHAAASARAVPSPSTKRGRGNHAGSRARRAGKPPGTVSRQRQAVNLQSRMREAATPRRWPFAVFASSSLSSSIQLPTSHDPATHRCRSIPYSAHRLHVTFLFIDLLYLLPKIL